MTEAIAAPRPPAVEEPAWKLRFRAPRVMFPTWARDDPDRLVYLPNATGKFEVHTWDRRTGEHHQLTDRSEGTGYRVPSKLEPSGERVWWFDDEKGNELGQWVRQPFGGGASERIAPDLAPAYSAGLALGHSFAIFGRSRGDEGTSVYLVALVCETADGETRASSPMRLYQHKQSATVGELSRSQSMFVLSHSEHGDSRNRALRILSVHDGTTIAEKWDGPGKGLQMYRWAPIRGDSRLLIGHERAGILRPLVWDVHTDHEDEVVLDLPGEVSADWYPDALSLLISHDHRGRTDLYRYEIASKRLERLPTERGTITAARVRPDG